MRVESTDRAEPAEGVDPATEIEPTDGAAAPGGSEPAEVAEHADAAEDSAAGGTSEAAESSAGARSSDATDSSGAVDSPDGAESSGEIESSGDAESSGGVEPPAVKSSDTEPSAEVSGGTEHSAAEASDVDSSGADSSGGTEPSAAESSGGESSDAESSDESEPGERTGGAPARIFAAAVDAVRHPRVPRTLTGRIVAAVLVLLLVAGVAGGVRWNAQRVPDGAALAVGDRVVTVSDLDDRVQTLRALYGVQPPVEDPARMDTFRRDAAKAVAVSMVLEDKAAEMGVGVADAKVRQTLDQYVTQQLGPGTAAHADFVKVLGNVGTSEDKVLAEIRQQMTVSELFNRVTSDVKISDDDLRAAFPRYAERLGKPETRDLSNIVVASKEAADKVVTDLRGGADFATVARTSSIDNSTRGAGGAMGPVSAGQLQPGYAQAAFATPSGQVFGPVQNQFGWNVGKVGAITPGVPANFDQVKDKLRPLVEFDRRLAVWSDWMHDALANGDVRYADDYLPADPDSAPTGGTPGQPPVAANPAPQRGGGG